MIKLSKEECQSYLAAVCSYKNPEATNFHLPLLIRTKTWLINILEQVVHDPFTVITSLLSTLYEL